MNANTNLFAVVVTEEITLITQGGITVPGIPELYNLHKCDTDAIQTAEILAKVTAQIDRVYGQPESGKLWEYVSTVDGRYDSEGNHIEQSEWKRVTAGNCEWDIAYTITLQNEQRKHEIHVCKWVDFEY